jgi:hypothetical protein
MMLAAIAIAAALCGGDCNGNGRVSVDELVTGVRVTLGEADVAECPAIFCDSGPLQIQCIVDAVGNALRGCPRDECAECFSPCFPDPHSPDCPCPESCGEFPVADGLQCAASLCFESGEQVRRCVHRLDDAGRCGPAPGTGSE